VKCDKFLKSLLRAGWKEDHRKEMTYYKENEKSLLIEVIKGKIKGKRVSLHIREYVERMRPSYHCSLYVDGTTIKRWAHKDLRALDIQKVLDNFCFQCEGYGKTTCNWWDSNDNRCATHETYCDKHGVEFTCENGLRICLKCKGKGTFNKQKLDRGYLVMIDKDENPLAYYRG